MKIIVLNGSPKGDMSVTMQYVTFIQKNFLQYDIDVINISQEIKTIENDADYFRSIINKIECCDVVLWAFPVYVLLVPSQYKRFIELVYERNSGGVFKNKYAASLSTSVHFYDHAAHNYVNSISDDLCMKYGGSFSADMHDLLDGKKRKQLLSFMHRLFRSVEEKSIYPKKYDNILKSSFVYNSLKHFSKVNTYGSKVLIVRDSVDSESLNAMVDNFSKCFSGNVEVVTFSDIQIAGGCLGCLRCAFDGVCAYENKDAFIKFYNSKISSADVIIFAGSIKDRFLSAQWKLFFDRCFFMTHIPTFVNKHIGYIISGPLRQISNLREILEAYAECQGGNLLGIITDEYNDSDVVTLLIENYANQLSQAVAMSYHGPKTFLSVGGRKVLRDDVWGRFRFIFQADHRFFKGNGEYDFPHKNVKMRITNNIMMLLTKMPRFKARIASKMKQALVQPYKKYLRKDESFQSICK